MISVGNNALIHPAIPSPLVLDFIIVIILLIILIFNLIDRLIILFWYLLSWFLRAALFGIGL